MEQREVPRQSVDLQDNPEVLSPPNVLQPYRCATKVKVTGFNSHASVDVEILDAHGITIELVTVTDAGFPLPDGVLVNVSNPLDVGQQVRARQRNSRAQSLWSNPVNVRDMLEDYPAGPPRPQINPAPVYQCGSRTGVSNLLVGGNVWITADGSERGRVEGCSDHQGVNVNPDYGLDEEVRAWFELCGDPSPPSEKHDTQTAPAPLPIPGFEQPHEDGEQLTITNIVNGARVTLYRNGINLGTSRCWGGRLRWEINPPFVTTDTFEASQRMCPGAPASDRGSTGVVPCSSLFAPRVGPVQFGDDRITVVEFVSDAVIKVYINLAKVGEGGGPVVELSRPIEYGDVVHVEQVLGDCRSSTVLEIIPGCVDAPVTYDPSALDLFPVGYWDYPDGDGDIRGSVYYPANDDGEREPFNERLGRLGRVPIVFMAHGNHATDVPNHEGYDYFQKALARMGIIAVSVDCNATNLTFCTNRNIEERVHLIIDSIEYFTRLDSDASSLFHQRINFESVGLMGHSRGGNAVVWLPELISLPDVQITSVLALAPTSCGFSSGRPRDYAFMTILPAGDGDVVSNDGAKYYDRAQPAPFKCQLYVHYTNHNFFNRQWLTDDGHGPPVMSRHDHERLLSVYGCAFFRSTLLGHSDTVRFLSGHMIPSRIAAEHVHLSFEQREVLTVDNHEDGNGIGRNSLDRLTSQDPPNIADEYPFGQVSGTFNNSVSFFGDSVGMVIESYGRFRSQLREPTDLTEREIWIRVAEVYNGTSIPPNATGFELGLEDSRGVVVWTDSDHVGGLPRPYHRRDDDLHAPDSWPGRDTTKTMLKTLRFRSVCFAAANPEFDIRRIVAILIHINRDDQRALAFDDLQII